MVGRIAVSETSAKREPGEAGEVRRCCTRETPSAPNESQSHGELGLYVSSAQACERPAVGWAEAPDGGG